MTFHPISPIYDANSRFLILGSFPSVKSREELFFYAHPQNRFWKVIAAVFAEEAPKTIDEKRAFLLRNNIALWDVIASCDIKGSSDSSIKNVIPNDVGKILKSSSINKIFVNGKCAEKYYRKYIENNLGRSAILLPSTSAANASWSIGALIEKWKSLIYIDE